MLWTPRKKGLVGLAWSKKYERLSGYANLEKSPFDLDGSCCDGTTEDLNLICIIRKVFVAFSRKPG
jgi:hypothetical protein